MRGWLGVSLAAAVAWYYVPGASSCFALRCWDRAGAYHTQTVEPVLGAAHIRVGLRECFGPRCSPDGQCSETTSPRLKRYYCCPCRYGILYQVRMHQALHMYMVNCDREKGYWMLFTRVSRLWVAIVADGLDIGTGVLGSTT